MRFGDTARTKWMFRNIQDAFQIYPPRGASVDDFFNGNTMNHQALEGFLSGQGPPKMMIYFQPDSSDDGDGRESMNESRLILTTGDNIKLENKGIFFLRTTANGKEINQDKIDSDILFGEITPDTLK